MIWFTSDLHFDHDNVVRCQSRPWEGVDAMNAGLIANIEAGILRFDVGVDANGYAPVSLTEVLGWAGAARENRNGRG